MARLEAQQQQQGGDEPVDVSEDGQPTSLRARAKASKASGGAEGSWRKEMGADTLPADGQHTPVTTESFAVWRLEWEVRAAVALSLRQMA